jgi:hypothetical protein
MTGHNRTLPPWQSPAALFSLSFLAGNLNRSRGVQAPGLLPRGILHGGERRVPCPVSVTDAMVE